MSPRLSLALTLMALLAGCAVGPDYQRPTLALPQQWAEATDGNTWQPAAPGDRYPRGEWWRIFKDETLDRLEQQALIGNFTLKAALARVEQARALLGISSSARSPTLDLSERSTRTLTSSNRPGTGNGAVTSTLQNDHVLGLGLSYEADLFGRIQRDVEASSAGLEQSQADLENARLILTADVASAYFALRSQEADIDLLQQTADLQERSLALVRSRYALGAVSGLDLAQQELLLGNTRSQWQLALRQQAQQRHALATLLGIDAARVELKKSALPTTLPDIPLALPGVLLQRRPDIASAERAVAAANAQIGVASSAWFPGLRISASNGLESKNWGALLDAPSNTWSLGLAFSQILFDGGRTRSRVAQAEAGHQLATANYRQTVLKALQEVEDALASRRTLAAAALESNRAASGAEKAANITASRYRLGAATALEHLVTEQNALNARRQVLQLEGQQWANAVLLIRALGGGWGE
ncbi:MAG: efflux transporter outer membrane subunit [Rhodocyclaceae bacterium]|nr:MAG: efflux transporter outer membrane subunit [Rhodocyclaceae bacterium]